MAMVCSLVRGPSGENFPFPVPSRMPFCAAQPSSASDQWPFTSVKLWRQPSVLTPRTRAERLRMAAA